MRKCPNQHGLLYSPHDCKHDYQFQTHFACSILVLGNQAHIKQLKIKLDIPTVANVLCLAIIYI